MSTVLRHDFRLRLDLDYEQARLVTKLSTPYMNGSVPVESQPLDELVGVWVERMAKGGGDPQELRDLRSQLRASVLLVEDALAKVCPEMRG